MLLIAIEFAKADSAVSLVTRPLVRPNRACNFETCFCPSTSNSPICCRPTSLKKEARAARAIAKPYPSVCKHQRVPPKPPQPTHCEKEMWTPCPPPPRVIPKFQSPPPPPTLPVVNQPPASSPSASGNDATSRAGEAGNSMIFADSG